MSEWEISKISGHCGAELTGVGLNHASASQLEALRTALFEHGVVVLPEQYLTPDAHIALAEFFGPIDINRFFTPVEEYPVIAEVRTAPMQSAVIGGTWHTDHSYDQKPAMCSILSARELPPFGGDTHFASMTAAYHGLSSGLQTTLSGLNAWHSDKSFANSKVGIESNSEDFRPAVLHPAVIRHPRTGAPALYVNGDFTTHFEGWSEPESALLLDYIYRFSTQPIFTCRIKWQAGMVVIWDNRLVQHFATGDYVGHARLMHRITVEGVELERFEKG